MMSHDLDQILAILENPTRRRILQKLSREPHYPLQLSKELKVSQQAIMKHLKVLEDLNLVTCRSEKSDVGGPRRKCYVASYNFSLIIDCAPNLFNAEVRPLIVEKDMVQEYKKFDKMREEVKSVRDPRKKLNRLSHFIHKLDEEIDRLETRRAYLVGLKNEAMREGQTIVEKLDRDYDERRLLYYMLDEMDRSLSRISERLNLREKVVKDMLKRLGESRILLDGGIE